MSDAFELPTSHIPYHDANACQTVVHAAEEETATEDNELIVIDTSTESADEECDAEALVVDLGEPKVRSEQQPMRDRYDGVRREDLRTLCRSSGMGVRGTRQELIERLDAVEELRA